MIKLLQRSIFLALFTVLLQLSVYEVKSMQLQLDSAGIKAELTHALKYIDRNSDKVINITLTNNVRNSQGRLLNTETMKLTSSKRILIIESSLVDKYIDSSSAIYVFHQPKSIYIKAYNKEEDNTNELFRMQNELIQRGKIQSFSSNKDTTKIKISWDKDIKEMQNFKFVEYCVYDEKIVGIRSEISSPKGIVLNEIIFDDYTIVDDKVIKFPITKYIYSNLEKKELIEAYTDYTVENGYSNLNLKKD